MARGDLDHVVSRRPGQIRVVEHDAARARGQLLVEGRGELAQRPAALVPVQAEVAPRRVLRRDTALPGPRDADHEDDLAVALRRRARALPAERRRRRSRRRGLRRRARRLRTARARNRDDDGREAEQPRERLRRVDACGALRPAEGRVGDQRDPELVAPLDDAAAKRPVVEGRERDLDRCDGSELERLVELAAVDVRDPDAPHEALVGEPGEGAHGRLPRRPWIRRVDEVEVDRQPVQRGEARLAVGRDRLRAAVRHPGAARPGHPALRHDPRALRSAAAAKGAGEQLLVAVVRARRVEDGHARLDGRGDRLERGLGRQAHAAEADAELRRVEPGHAEGCSSGTAPLQPERRTSTSDGGVISDASPAPSRTALGVAGRGPAPQLAAEHEPRLVPLEHERTVGKVRELGSVQPPSARRVEPLRVEALVDLVGPRADERHEAVVVLAAAERTRPVAGGERRRLVEEEQLREPAGLEQPRPLPVLELEPAGDPALDGEAAPDPAGLVVEAAAVSVDETAGRVRDQLAEGRDAILQRHRVEP